MTVKYSGGVWFFGICVSIYLAIKYHAYLASLLGIFAYTYGYIFGLKIPFTTTKDSNRGRRKNETN